MKNKHFTKNCAGRKSSISFALMTLAALPILVNANQLDPEQRIRPLEDIAAYEAREKAKASSPAEKGAPVSAVRPNISKDFITYLYLQTEDTVFHLRWHALTHISSLFVYIDSDGNFTNRAGAWDGRSSYLKAGGAAEASGTKVILTVTSFDDAPGGAIEQVMTTPAKRTTLVNNIINALQTDAGAYNCGVNFDLEFSWGTSVRDGIVLFLQELRTAMDSAGMQDKEISFYTNPTLNTNQWDISGMEPYLDYLLYSGYTFAGSTTVNAVGDHASMTGSDSRIPGYLEQGLPPEKLVITLPAYGRRYTGATSYGDSGTRGSAVGFTDGLYETTISTAFGGPQTNQYQTGDESAWYTYNDGTDDITAIWEGLEGINYKIRQALAVQDPTGGLNFDGAKVRGIGYWSSLWMAETSSYDPRTSSSVTRTRTYPHISQTLQEALAPAGTTQFFAERWEGYDFRWRDPYRALDTSGDTDNNSSWDVVSAPAGLAIPSNNAARVIFDFEAGTNHTGVFAHEVLNSNIVPGATDYHAVLANFDSTTKLQAQVYTPSALVGQTVRMLVLDSDLELEAGPTISLNSIGWQTLEFDLTDAGSVSGFTTSEPNFSNGDGVIDSAGGSNRDIGFYGFVVQGAGSGVHTVYFDELTYEEAFPNNAEYVINEFRYDGSAGEFVEIHGPTGALPAGLQLRVIDGADGSITTKAISGSIDGSGLFVFGDSDVPNVDSSTGFGVGTNELLNTSPSALQLYDSVTGTVYDSVVYEAFGGIDDLVRLETLGVADEGYPWLGRAANGTDNSGAVYTKGRYPDGNDTNINADDFGSMVATPGTSNGGSIPGNVATYNFDTAPASAIQTFQTFSVGASAVGASPSGGNVHRSVDTTGGGVMSFIGDAALDATVSQVRITGELYIPGGAEPAQAIAIGLCGTQGSTFFTASPGTSGYENGYWLIYENQAGVGLNDGRPDHPGVFEFVHATHDNMDSAPVTLLSSTAIGSTGATAGAWTTFEFIIDANASPSSQLIAIVGGTTVYSGAIPDGGPTRGAFQVGFRENHAGGPAATEGTWIDNIQFNPSARVDDWETINQN